MDSPNKEEASRFARGLARAVGAIGRHPYLVLAAVFLSCAVCAVYTLKNLTYLTRRDDLISKNKEYLKRWRQYVSQFGDDDDMVVVVRGQDRPQMEKVLDELAGEIHKRPETFERLFYKVDLTALHNRALLFLPTEQIRLVQGHIQGMSLLLDPPVIGNFLDPIFGWKSLSVQQLLREAERKLEVWKPGQSNKEAEEYFRQLEAIANGACDYLEAPSRYRNPWQRVLPAPSGPSQDDYLAKPQYFFSGDGTLAILTVSPVKDADPDNFTGAKQSIDALRGLIAAVKTRHPGIDIGLTGLPVLENDEMLASQKDSSFASWLAILGVAVLYVVVYRGYRFPLTTVASLMVGTIWALGWLTLTIGHLNILSSAFAVMLIGIGDYGVLWVTRFGQERQAGRDIAAANRETALRVGPSILTASITTACAFFAAMLADLQAVTELGWIAGCGVLFCACSCFLVAPALLTIFDYRLCPKEAADAMVLPLQCHQAARREWLPALMRRPRFVMAVCAFAAIVCAGYAMRIHYDHNLLNMQSPRMESVQWEHTLMDKMTGSSWYAVSWTRTPEEALALKADYEKLPAVSNVITLASLMPGDQGPKLDMLRDIQQRLAKLPQRGAPIPHATPNLDDIDHTCARVIKACARVRENGPNPALEKLEASVGRLHSAVIVAQGSRLKLARAATIGRLKEFDEKITGDLAEDLHRLRDVSTPTPIRLADLPANLRERYIGKDGQWLVRVFSKETLWDFEPLEAFVRAVRSVDTDATGKPFTTLEGLKAMRDGFLWAALYALAAMVLVLFIDFGRARQTLLALSPLALGMIATLGVMSLFGLPLNPANMIGFPLILGVGVDNGVHVLNDFRNRDKSRPYRLTQITGFGILIKALTTVLGFGTLMIAEHRGMASLGLILTVGVSCCMLTALVFLPTLLHVIGRRVEPNQAETLPMPQSRAA